MRLSKTAFSILLTFVCMSRAGGAAEINGLPFADHVTIATKTLTLNGMGLRQATFLKVNVYAGALYLETPSHDGDQIAQSTQLKHLEMTFMRDVGSNKIADAWAEGFEKNCVENCATAQPGIAKLQSVTPDMKKGDKMVFDFLQDHIEVSIKGQKPVSIDGKDFSKSLILLWIGHNPPNTGLKAGLLGVKG